MTPDQKFKSVIKRLKMENLDFEPEMLSILMVTKYLVKFQELHIIDGAATLTENGNKVASVAEEFNWSPNDKDIEEYVNALVSTNDNPNLIKMIKEYRDNPEIFLGKYTLNSNKYE